MGVFDFLVGKSYDSFGEPFRMETRTFVAFAGYLDGLGSCLAHRTFREVDISSSATQGFHYSNVADHT